MTLNRSDPDYREVEGLIKKYVADEVKPLRQKVDELEGKIATLERKIASIVRLP
jgi:ubiquinone biosynthesis protein UbiJ